MKNKKSRLSRFLLNNTRCLITVALLCIFNVTMPLLAFAANITGIPDTASYSATTDGDVAWSYKDGEFSATTKYIKNGCTQQQATLTITSKEAVAATISFDCFATGNVGTFTIDGVDYKNKTSFTKEITSSDHAVTIVIQVSKTSDGEATAKISNIRIEKKQNITVTYAPVEGITYTVNDVTVSKETGPAVFSEVPNTNKYTISNGTGSSGTVYYTKAVYTSGGTDNLYPDENNQIEPKVTGTITPVFVADDDGDGTAPFKVGSRYFWTWETAFKAGTPVILNDNYTLPAGDYTVPTDFTFFIPCEGATEPSTTPNAYNTTGASNAHTATTAYRTLTMASNANIAVDGTLNIGGKQNAVHGNNGAPFGPVGVINMAKNSSITINSNAFLYAWGHIIGDGTVTVESTGTVYECFELQDFRGGKNTAAMEGNSYRVFPFNQFYVQNVHVPMTLKAGAIEYGHLSFAVSGVQSVDIPFIGPKDCMFTITSGHVTKDYIENTDRIAIDIYGNVSISPISFSVKVYSLGTLDVVSSKYELPIPGGYTINVHNGYTATVSQNLAILPGAELWIDTGANVTLSQGASVFVYDLDDSGDFTVNITSAGIAGGSKLRPAADGYDRTYIRTTADLKDAKITVNGIFDASKGYLYTTDTGANICSDGGGVVMVNPGTAKETYQYNSSAGSYSIPITFTKLKNIDGSYLHHNSANSYIYTDGFWYCEKTHTGMDDGVCDICGYSEHEHTFTGEYVSDGNATLYEDGTKSRFCDTPKCGKRQTVTDEGSRLAAAAKIGEVLYLTLPEAIKAAESGDTVELLKDVALDNTLTITADKNMILDLSEYTITCASTAVKNQGMLSITGNGGVIECTGNANAVLNNATIDSISGTVTLKSVSTSALNVSGTNASVNKINGDGQVEILSSTYWALTIQNTCTVGEISGNVVIARTEDTTAGAWAIAIYGKASIGPINSCYLYTTQWFGSFIYSYKSGDFGLGANATNGAEGYVTYGPCRKLVTSPTVPVLLNDGSRTLACAQVAYSHTPTLVPGTPATFEADGWKDSYHCDTCGGDFSDAAGKKPIADLEVWKTGEGKIPRLTAVAEVNSTKYATLDAAVTAAQNGQTVKLLDNVKLTETLTIPEGKELTLALDGYTISADTSSVVRVIENKGTLSITGNGGTISINNSVECAVIYNEGTIESISGIVTLKATGSKSYTLRSDGANAEIKSIGGEGSQITLDAVYAGLYLTGGTKVGTIAAPGNDSWVKIKTTSSTYAATGPAAGIIVSHSTIDTIGENVYISGQGYGLWIHEDSSNKIADAAIGKINAGNGKIEIISGYMNAVHVEYNAVVGEISGSVLLVAERENCSAISCNYGSTVGPVNGRYFYSSNKENLLKTYNTAGYPATTITYVSEDLSSMPTIEIQAHNGQSYVCYHLHEYGAWTITECPGFAPSGSGGERVHTCGVCGEEETEALEPLKLQANIAANNSLDIYFYLTDAEIEILTSFYGEDSIKAVITRSYNYDTDRDDDVREIPLSEWEAVENDGEASKRFGYNGIAAKEMTDNLCIRIYAGEKLLKDTPTYSVATYAENLLTNQTDELLVTAMVDMLNYGAEAQAYFGYHTEELANAGIDEWQSYASKSVDCAGDALVADDTYFAAASVSAKNNLMYTFYFNLNGAQIQSAEVSYWHYNKTAGEAVTVSVEEFVTYKNYTGVDITGLYIADGRQTVSCKLTLTDGQTVEVKDSIEAYVYRAGTSGVYAKLMMFSDSAKAYFTKEP